MNGNRNWARLVTIGIIFVAGLVAGIWLCRRTPPPPPPVAIVESGETVVSRVYRELSPAVVNIVALRLRLAPFYWMKPIPEPGQGTGFVIDTSGHIVTNNHVVANAVDLEVTFSGGNKVRAKLVGRDPRSDLAVIKIEPFTELVPAPLGDSDHVTVGQFVVAIGNPFGLQNTVTAGYISALNRDLVLDGRQMMGMMQTDAAINPGNSGGPLINSQGHVIGMNTAIYSQTGGFTGIGLAVPINRSKKVAAQIIRWGRPIYPWIGIEYSQDLDPNLARDIGLPPVTGILIYKLADGSPALNAGLKGATHPWVRDGRLMAYRGRPIVLGGDVILSLDGQPTPTIDEFENVIMQKVVGQPIRLTILRGTQQLTVDVPTVPDPRIPPS
jgi:S1-C subfamily serine protease